MKKIMCDICGRNEAKNKFKVKRSNKYDASCFGDFGMYYRLDVCSICGKALFDAAKEKHNSEKHNKKSASLLMSKKDQKTNTEENAWQWIPVKEKLPENTGDYMVSTKAGSVMKAKYKKEKNNFYLVGTLSDILLESVIAWMPMSKAYTEERGIK